MGKERQHVSASVLGNGALMSEGIAWGGQQERRPVGPRKFFGRLGSGLVWVFCGLIAMAVYMNVIVDDGALRARTDSMARQHAGCGDQCHVTRMQGRRTVLDYRADYDIEGVGNVEVVCRRSAIVLGDHVCRAR
jgi:hypothetical protein